MQLICARWWTLVTSQCCVANRHILIVLSALAETKKASSPLCVKNESAVMRSLWPLSLYKPHWSTASHTITSQSPPPEANLVPVSFHTRVETNRLWPWSKTRGSSSWSRDHSPTVPSFYRFNFIYDFPICLTVNYGYCRIVSVFDSFLR